MRQVTLTIKGMTIHSGVWSDEDNFVARTGESLGELGGNSWLVHRSAVCGCVRVIRRVGRAERTANWYLGSTHLEYNA